MYTDPNSTDDDLDFSLGVNAPADVFTVPAELRAQSTPRWLPVVRDVRGERFCSPRANGTTRHFGVIEGGRCSLCMGAR